MCDHCRERQRGYMGRTKRHPKPPVPREDVTQSTISKRPRTESAVYSMADVAGLFGIGYTTIWTMVQDGTFPVKPIRIGRQVKFPKRIVDQMLGIDDD